MYELEKPINGVVLSRRVMNDLGKTRLPMVPKLSNSQEEQMGNKQICIQRGKKAESVRKRNPHPQRQTKRYGGSKVGRKEREVAGKQKDTLVNFTTVPDYLLLTPNKYCPVANKSIQASTR